MPTPTSAATTSTPRSPWLLPATIACFFWAAGWIVVSRYAMLDDALIHLRYAVNLAHTHHITYDGIHPTFGTSSPLYVSLLAVLYSLWPSALLPKVVSTLAYAGLLLACFRLFLRCRANRTAAMLASCLLAIQLCPMAIRWLTDGMETSLVCLAVLFVDFAAFRAAARDVFSVPLLIATFLLTTLRIELAALGCCLALVLFFAARDRGVPMVRALRNASAPLLGTLFALLGIRLLFGSFLPDTALAKSSGITSFFALIVYAQTAGSAFLLGIGSLLVWLVTLVLALRRNRAPYGRLALLAANVNFPLLLAVSCLRDQLMAVRYTLWATLFSTAWNLLVLASASAVTSRRMERLLPVAAMLLVVLLLPFDTAAASRILTQRGHTYTQMRDDHLDRLAGHPMIADDIGFIGYFSRADVCDLNGLIHGPAFATLGPDQRARACVDRPHDALFLTPSSIALLTHFLPDLTTAWVACDVIDFPNVHSPDRHYLLVRRIDVPRLCPPGKPLLAVSELKLT